MNDIVGITEGAHMHGEEGGQMVDRVDHSVGAGRAVPAEFAQLSAASHRLCSDAGAHAQTIGIALAVPGIKAGAAPGPQLVRAP